ncbi:integrase catalytic domain-containing protein [Trichonephila inaurata madagascariensis]|uniref:Integrase catalytic domain-containing protein n=1 Tax=Trichonephila inaurata madagascariensis TaxID=2747483 RepID=A0A8X7C4W3_9ARAC|nr:integrase catalytic domain-containing protein [Trichonephila inaurata madagascariensis]
MVITGWLCRSSCLCLDFEIHKNSRSPVLRTFGYLKSSELHTAVVTIVRLIQQQAEFPNEIKYRVRLVLTQDLTELSRSVRPLNALTPAHLLVGGPIHQFPEPSQPSRSVALSERWNLIQRLRQYFWDRWSTEYLHRLQPRSKWWRTKPSLKLGDMVIVEKEQTAPLNWTLGRINKLFFEPDQKVRVVSVNTKYGQLTRNVKRFIFYLSLKKFEL